MASSERTSYGFFGLLWRMAVAGTIVLGLSGAAGYLAVAYVIEKPETTAPDLLTMDLGGAVKKASKDGFPVLVQGDEPSDYLEPGYVLAQRPEPGAFVKNGATIRVTLARRP